MKSTTANKKASPKLNKDTLRLKDFLDVGDSDAESPVESKQLTTKKKKKTTATVKEIAILDTENSESNESSTSDSDKQLFYIRTTNKIIRKK